MTNLFDLTGKVAVVTGGAGYLGLHFVETLLEVGAKVVMLDVKGPSGVATDWLARAEDERRLMAEKVNVAKAGELLNVYDLIIHGVGFPDILVNAACNNPRVEQGMSEDWAVDLAVGLTGARLCSEVFGAGMAQRGHGGTIVNIASEYSVIAPDQRLYRKPGLLEHQQPIKPSSYSVVKHGLVGLTKWLATRWGDRGVRVNCLSPGGVANGQPAEFVERYVNTIPLGRMATPADLQGALLFLCSDASQFVTGHNLVVDGGRSCW